MINAMIAKAFVRIADLLEIDGADGFRVNSYRRAARVLKDTTEDVAALAVEGTLTKLPGIGKGAASRIQQFIETGKIDVLTELQAKLPADLPRLLDIPGLGPKKIAAMHAKLGVCGFADMKRVIESGELADLSGFGATSVKRIVEGMTFLERSAGRTPIGIAFPIAEALLERVRNLPGVQRAEIAGSLRRGKETIGDIDLLCEAANGAEVVEAFTRFEDVSRILAAGRTKGSVTVALEDGRELQIDLRVVLKESYGAALQYFTGSKEHNVRLRERAVKRKLRLNEYGLYEGERQIAGSREEDIYKQLDAPFVAPELREDRGEFDDKGDAPKLVTEADIRGDLHMHTVASDGKHTIDEMALAAKDSGYKYIAITDHSKSSTIANGLGVERLEKHLTAIREADERIVGIKIFAGTECDILPDGTMDYPDDLLAKCDWVIASIHSAMGKGGSGKLSPTERTLAAIENRYVTMIAHPTGRLINRRAPMEMDMAAIVKAAADNDTVLEINANWQRLDLKDVHVRMALAAGATIAINTDAHSTEGIGVLRYGIMTARRGGARKRDVLNCLTLAALEKRIAARRA